MNKTKKFSYVYPDTSSNLFIFIHKKSFFRNWLNNLRTGASHFYKNFKPFYFICRMMGFFLVMIGNMYSNITELRWYMSKALYFISIFIPRFDLYGQSKWLIYGAAGDGNLWVFILQSLIFIPFLLLMAFSDFRRKQF